MQEASWKPGTISIPTDLSPYEHEKCVQRGYFFIQKLAFMGNRLFFRLYGLYLVGSHF